MYIYVCVFPVIRASGQPIQCPKTKIFIIIIIIIIIIVVVVISYTIDVSYTL